MAPETIDDHFLRRVAALEDGGGSRERLPSAEEERLCAYFDAQIRSRHADFAMRGLQRRGEGFYTIGSSGHESNAAVALALRPTDPALLHYRSGAFYAARAGQVSGVSAVDDMLRGAMGSVADGISGGRHKVFGSKALNVIPQTSTIASHLPRALGLASALGWLGNAATSGDFPDDAVVVCSFGDASLNHSTAMGALNAVSYCDHRGLEVPMLLVCEDNGFGISVRTPTGWVTRRLQSLPGIRYARASGERPIELLRLAEELVGAVRSERRPRVLHLDTVRFMGHAGSDAEIAYRTPREVAAEHLRDPLVATATVLVEHGILSPADVLARYESTRADVEASAQRVPREFLASADDVREPIAHPMRSAAVEPLADLAGARGEGMTLAQSINATLADAMSENPDILVFGEDVGRKGGVYGLTKGLLRTFGPGRVFDSLLDEQTILGMALGTALAGYLPVPEIQYLAYLHNAEDQLRGEAATLPFFSAGQYTNGMVVRVAGLAYQKGFGGHFHNDNSVAVLTDVPGLVLAVPSSAASAPALLRQCLALAAHQGRVCVYLEPIALYHERDIEDDDGAMLAPYVPSNGDDEPFRPRTVRNGTDLLIITFGNGVRMSLRAAGRLAGEGIDCEILDLQYLSPLPAEALRARARDHCNVLVVDETRRSGGVAPAVMAALLDGGFTGDVVRVTSADSFIPLGPAAAEVLLAQSDIETAARALVRPAEGT